MLGKRVLFRLLLMVGIIMLVGFGCARDAEEASNEQGQNREKAEQGEAAEQLVLQEKVTLDGDYADKIKELDLPIDESEWETVHYEETDRKAVAEYVKKDDQENSKGQEIFTVHFYARESRNLDMENFITVMEEELKQLATGKVVFDIIESSEKNGMYEFHIKDDEELDDQEEIGSVFQHEDELYVIRYTVVNQEMKDKEQWMEELQQINK